MTTGYVIRVLEIGRTSTCNCVHPVIHIETVINQVYKLHVIDILG
jgi:hypothetical protein